MQISWLLKKPTDLDLHCLLRQGMSCLAREGLIMSLWESKITVFTLEVLGHLNFLLHVLKVEKKSILLPVDMSKIVLDEWQTV